MTEQSKSSKWYLNKEFWIGFGGWFVINGLSWALVNMFYGLFIIVWIALILGNIGALIYFAFKNRPCAFGILCAFAINFLVLLMRGMGEQVICFNPFFIEVNVVF